MKPHLILPLAIPLVQAQPIPLRPVTSSAIHAAGYDAPTQRMQIQFTQGKGVIYDFCAVPEPVFQALLNAPSKGTFYHQAIRDKYPCEDLMPKLRPKASP